MRDQSGGPGRQQGRPRAFRQDDALEIAMEAFWTGGYQATGTQELFGRMGIGRQSAYNAFGDKRRLFLAALRRYGDTRVAGMVDVLDRPGAGLPEVTVALRRWGMAGTIPPRSGCLLVNTLAEFGSRDPDVEEALASQVRQIRDAFRRGLRGAVAAGDVPPDTDVETHASLFVAVGIGCNLLGKAGASADELERIIDASIARLRDA